MSHHDLRPGQVLGERYRLDRALGTGALGTVYAAEDLLLTRPVAVKVIDQARSQDPEVAEAVRRAGSLMASMSHPGLVTVYDATQVDDRFCIVMEFVPGPHLGNLIEDGGISPQLAARIGSQAAAALQKIHDLDRVHGSVTPSNVLVTPGGSAKLVDIGLGPELGNGSGAATRQDDVRALAGALRGAIADPATSDAGDLVDVLDHARSDGSGWSAGQLADALRVIAGDAKPGPITAGLQDRQATVSMAAPAVTARDDVTQVLPSPDTHEIPTTAPMTAGSSDPEIHKVEPPATERPLRPAWFGRALLILAVVAVVAVVATRGDRPDGSGGEGDAAEPVTIQAASDFDPLGGGGEHGDEVQLAYDGDPATAWTTEGYNQPDLGGIKTGVGIWFDLGASESIVRVQLTMPVAGADFALYAFDSPPGSDPAGWGAPVATGSDSPATQTIEASGDGRYWLVWLTNLGPDEDRFRGGVSEIAFAAR